MIGAASRSFHFGSRLNGFGIETMVMMMVPADVVRVPLQCPFFLHVGIVRSAGYNLSVFPSVTQRIEVAPISGKFGQQLLRLAHHHHVYVELMQGRAWCSGPMRPNRDCRAGHLANRLR